MPIAVPIVAHLQPKEQATGAMQVQHAHECAPRRKEGNCNNEALPSVEATLRMAAHRHRAQELHGASNQAGNNQEQGRQPQLGAVQKRLKNGQSNRRRGVRPGQMPQREVCGEMWGSWHPAASSAAHQYSALRLAWHVQRAQLPVSRWWVCRWARPAACGGGQAVPGSRAEVQSGRHRYWPEPATQGRLERGDRMRKGAGAARPKQRRQGRST